MTTTHAPQPEGEPTILRLVDGEWQIPDIAERFHQDLASAWEGGGGEALDVIVYIQKHRRG